MPFDAYMIFTPCESEIASLFLFMLTVLTLHPLHACAYALAAIGGNAQITDGNAIWFCNFRVSCAIRTHRAGKGGMSSRWVTITSQDYSKGHNTSLIDI